MTDFALGFLSGVLLAPGAVIAAVLVLRRLDGEHVPIIDAPARRGRSRVLEQYAYPDESPDAG